jgi:hypothetical protein
LLLGVFLAAAALAQPTILKGVDVFQTSTGANPTLVDFSTNPIPAGFFCAGSAPFTGQIALQGVPLTTSPAGVTANGDVIVERLTDGVFVGGSATIDVIVRALRLTGVNTFTAVCGDGTTTTWRVDTCLCGQQKVTKIVAKVDQACGCGHFDGQLSLDVCLTFTNVETGRVLGPVKQQIILKISNMPWCPKPGNGEPVISESFKVASKCGGTPDLLLPKSSNFHPGWDCSNQGVDCMTQYANLTHCHDANPPITHKHCINPICKPRQP